MRTFSYWLLLIVFQIAVLPDLPVPGADTLPCVSCLPSVRSPDHNGFSLSLILSVFLCFVHPCVPDILSTTFILKPRKHLLNEPVWNTGTDG